MRIINDTGACRKRFVFVNLDACMASQGVTLTVLEQLKASPLRSTDFDILEPGHMLSCSLPEAHVNGCQ